MYCCHMEPQDDAAHPLCLQLVILANFMDMY